MKNLLLVMALVVPIVAPVSAIAGKKRPAAAQPKTPTPAEVDASLKRIYGYDPSIQWKIFLVRRSAVPGMNEVLLHVVFTLVGF